MPIEKANRWQKLVNRANRCHRRKLQSYVQLHFENLAATDYAPQATSLLPKPEEEVERRIADAEEKRSRVKQIVPVRSHSRSSSRNARAAVKQWTPRCEEEKANLKRQKRQLKLARADPAMQALLFPQAIGEER